MRNTFTKLLVLSFLAISLSAYSQNIMWFKANVEKEEFMNARWSCAQIENSPQKIDACVKQKGWQIINKDRMEKATEECRKTSKVNDDIYFDCMKNQGFDVETRLQHESRSYRLETAKLCGKNEYQEIFKKTNCNDSSPSVEQLTDEAKINQFEKTALLNYMKERAELQKKLTSMYRSVGGTLVKKYADYLDTTNYPAEEVLNLDLYKGKVTWGDYNQGRKVLMTQYIALQKKSYEEYREDLITKSKESNEKVAKFIENKQITNQQKQQQENENRQRDGNANATANRESQCQFVRSQEYFKPVAGGFIQSMQNAESAFNNCMAGIPRITTNCSRDAFGQVNCVSQ